jgi:D-amino-acid dehydrogenase
MNEDVKSKSSVGVIGAGIQGLCISLSLVKEGFKVTLIDREDPGKESASYGNAGHFSSYASVPFNRPDVLVDVPSMLFSSTGPLALKWNYVYKMIPWFLKFIKQCSKKNMMHTAKYMHQILDLAIPAYDELFSDIDISGLVESKGIIYFWTKKDLKSRELEINIRNELGVKQQLLTPYEIHDLEPHIKKIYHGGVLYPYARHARNPRKILLKLFDLFLKRGGQFERQNAQSISFTPDNKPVIITALSKV